jgi:hypothetical protein
MSAPQVPPPSPGRKYSGGQIAMIVIGVILLLPGLCSILFIVGMAPEFNAKSFNDPFAQLIFALWGICFAISAAGIAIIMVVRKRARVTP